MGFEPVSPTTLYCGSISGADNITDVIIRRSEIKAYFGSLGYWAEISAVLPGAGRGVKKLMTPDGIGET